MADPFLEALGIKDPTATAAPKAAKAPAKAYDPLDAAVRTAMVEEADPTGQQWVAGVIRNRTNGGKRSILDVVQEKGQFEPWMTPEGRAKIDAIDPNSDEYKAVLARVAPILKGEAPDPSGGATHFYAPKAQAELAKVDGRPAKAEFDDGTGVQAGQSLFFGGKGKAPDAFLASIGADEAKANAAAAERAKFTAEGLTTFRDMEEHLTPGQQKFHDMLVKGGGYKPADPSGKLLPGGTASNPYYMQSGVDEADIPPGAFYVPREGGGIKQAPTGKEEHAGILPSLARGAADVATTVAGLYPGSEDSTLRNRLLTDQAVYDAQFKGDAQSGAGRFAGQILGAAPIAAGVEAATGAGLTRVGLPKVAAFLGGEAGAGAPGLAGFLTRGGSLATRGAVQGGVGGAVLDPDQQPLAQRVGEGALGGALLGPALPAVQSVGRGVGNFAGRFTYGGREKAIDRLFGEVAPKGFNLDTRQLVPGSFPTMAESAGDAGISAVERNARTNPKLTQVFQERMDANANARRDFFEGLAKDPEAIANAEAARETATAKLRADAFKGAKPADPTGVISLIDSTLAGPAGQRNVVVKALREIRGKLVQDSGLPGVKSMQTDVEQLYGIRKSIGDMLDPLGPQESRGATLAKSELMAVKGALDKAIEKAAPGFKGYLSTYADMSKPIDEMKLLQSMRLTDQHGNLTLAKVQGAIDKIEAQRGAGGANKAKSVSADTLESLKALRDDLKRASNIMKGKAPGSDTRQNLAMDAFAEGGGIPLAAGQIAGLKLPGAAFLIGQANKAVSGQNDKAIAQLGARLLDPEALRAPVIPQSVKVLGPAQRLAAPVLPLVGGQLVNRLTGP